MDGEETLNGSGITRRSFVTFIGGIFTSLFVLGLLPVMKRFFFPSVLYEPEMTFKAGNPKDYAIGEVDERWKKDFRTWIINDEKGLYALVATCTHLGCTPNWIKANNRFQCPCHGGVFTKEGDVVAGPPPNPLYRAAISLDPRGEIRVDKGFQENKPGLRDKEPFLLKI